MCAERAVYVARNNTIFGLSAIFRDVLRSRLVNKEGSQSNDEPLQGVQVQECSPCCCEARGEVGWDDRVIRWAAALHETSIHKTHVGDYARP